MPADPGGQRLDGRARATSSPTPTWSPASARTTVRLDNGRGAHAAGHGRVSFDANRDLALLVVPGLPEPPLPLSRRAAGRRPAQAQLVGTKGAVFGHPGGQDADRGHPVRRQPVRLRPRADLYDQPRHQAATCSSWRPT